MHDVCVYLFGLGMYGARPKVSSSSAAKDGHLNSHWCMYVCMNMNGNVRKHYYHFSLTYRPTTSLTHPLLRRSRVRNLEPAHVEPFHSFLSSDSTQKRISMHSFIHTYNTFAYPVLHNALYNTIYRRIFFLGLFHCIGLRFRDGATCCSVWALSTFVLLSGFCSRKSSSVVLGEYSRDAKGNAPLIFGQVGTICSGSVAGCLIKGIHNMSISAHSNVVNVCMLYVMNICMYVCMNESVCSWPSSVWQEGLRCDS